MRHQLKFQVLIFCMFKELALVKNVFTGKGFGMATVQNENENNDIKTLLRIGYGIKFDVSCY